MKRRINTKLVRRLILISLLCVSWVNSCKEISSKTTKSSKKSDIKSSTKTIAKDQSLALADTANSTKPKKRDSDISASSASLPSRILGQKCTLENAKAVSGAKDLVEDLRINSYIFSAMFEFILDLKEFADEEQSYSKEDVLLKTHLAAQHLIDSLFESNLSRRARYFETHDSAQAVLCFDDHIVYHSLKAAISPIEIENELLKKHTDAKKQELVRRVCKGSDCSLMLLRNWLLKKNGALAIFIEDSGAKMGAMLGLPVPSSCIVEYTDLVFVDTLKTLSEKQEEIDHEKERKKIEGELKKIK